MFRLRKPKERKQLLGLALNDSDWVVEKSTTLAIDHENKTIGTPMYEVDGELTKNLHKLMAVVQTKYGKPRKLVGVKHMTKYVDIAMNMSIYWYIVKKADKFLPARWTARGRNTIHHNVLWYYRNTLGRTNDETLRKFIVDTLSSSAKMGRIEWGNLAHYLSNMPGTIEEVLSLSRYTLMSRLEETMETTDAVVVVKQWNTFLDVLATAYKMVWSTRKDAKIVPNKKIKQVAEYLYNELEDMSNKDIILPTSFLEEYDMEQDGLGVLTDEDMSDVNNIVMGNMARRTGEEAKWGVMKIDNPELTQRLPVKVQAVAKKKSDTGINPRAMHRFTTDRKVFTNKTKRNGGTLLIDGSGSMHFDSEDIENLVHILPASTVAMYQGLVDDDLADIEWKETDIVPTGTLGILASKGKWVEEIPKYGYNNIIDGPAMDWLGKQQEPRIIITDMQVSGICKDDNYGTPVPVPDFNPELTIDALKKVKEYNIIVIPTVEKAVEWAKAYVKQA